MCKRDGLDNIHLGDKSTLYIYEKYLLLKNKILLLCHKREKKMEKKRIFLLDGLDVTIRGEMKREMRYVHSNILVYKKNTNTTYNKKMREKMYSEVGVVYVIK